MLQPQEQAALLPPNAQIHTALVLLTQLSHVVFKMSVKSILHFHEPEVQVIVQLPVEGSTISLG